LRAGGFAAGGFAAGGFAAGAFGAGAFGAAFFFFSSFPVLVASLCFCFYAPTFPPFLWITPGKLPLHSLCIGFFCPWSCF